MSEPVFEMSTEFPCDICGNEPPCVMVHNAALDSRSDICESCARAMVALFDAERGRRISVRCRLLSSKHRLTHPIGPTILSCGVTNE